MWAIEVQTIQIEEMKLVQMTFGQLSGSHLFALSESCPYSYFQTSELEEEIEQQQIFQQDCFTGNAGNVAL